MGSRIVATAILIAGIAALLVVGLGGNNTESVEPSPPAEPTAVATTPATTADISPTAPPNPPVVEEPAIEEPENYGQRMDLVNIDGWLNTDASSIDEFNGKVLLVEMWTFGCSNCKARIPFNQSYQQEFADENFEIIGVHAPEFSFEAEVPNIVEAAERLGVTWPIALDTNKVNFRAWQPGSTNYWPRTYVIDQNGDIRYDHIGEGKYEELRETIRFLIENPPLPSDNA